MFSSLFFSSRTVKANKMRACPFLRQLGVYREEGCSRVGPMGAIGYLVPRTQFQVYTQTDQQTTSSGCSSCVYMCKEVKFGALAHTFSYTHTECHGVGRPVVCGCPGLQMRVRVGVVKSVENWIFGILDLMTLNSMQNN